MTNHACTCMYVLTSLLSAFAYNLVALICEEGKCLSKFSTKPYMFQEHLGDIAIKS